MTSKNPSPFLRDRRSGLCARRRAAVIIVRKLPSYPRKVYYDLEIQTLRNTLDRRFGHYACVTPQLPIQMLISINLHAQNAGTYTTQSRNLDGM